MNITFSVIVVCLNPGDKLNETLDSILSQTYGDYEIVVKDGGSTDGSIQAMREDEHIYLYTEKDTGIYDAMNQAVAHADGDFVIFMNCGDVFHHDTVLAEAAERIRQEKTKENLVLYGDTFSHKNGVLITSPPVIDGFACYRNIPCHQSCFYATDLCRNKPYDLQYRIRADYDHFLWCFYKAKARMIYLDMPVSSYEGGGYSESKENRKRDKAEHQQITASYMSRKELFKYRAVLWCTLAPLRRALAESKLFSGVYHKMKRVLYRK